MLPVRQGELTPVIQVILGCLKSLADITWLSFKNDSKLAPQQGNNRSRDNQMTECVSLMLVIEIPL